MALFIVAIPLSILVYSKVQGASYEKVKVIRSQILSTVTASGKIKSKTEADLKFPISGKLAAVKVKVNDRVVKGQVVASLNTQSLSTTLQKARNDLLAKQATAQKVADDVKDHDKDETFTQKEKRVAAEAARDSAYDTVKDAQRALDDAVLISPVDGIATEVNGTAGEWITSLDNKTIAKIADPSNIYFEAEVPQEDSIKVAVGQKVWVELDAAKDKVLEGIVYEVADFTSKNSEGDVIIPVKIKLNADLNLKVGYEGDAQIIIEEKQNVLLVPKKAVAKDNQSVYVPKNSFIPFFEGLIISTKKVKLGTFDGSKWEVLEGINESEDVLVKK